jgi:voltage-gated potassium channel
MLLARNYLGTSLTGGAGIHSIVGATHCEHRSEYRKYWDGIWWAWVTVATVGYGDIVPQSVAGKVLAAVVMLFGLGFFLAVDCQFFSLFHFMW